MSLHSLVSSLLPAAYREQVIGDLQERGFRLRDVANVLPRVWASYMVRRVTGPTPQLALASEEAVIMRTQQLWKLGRLAASVALGLAAMARSYPFSISTGSRVAIALGAWVLLGVIVYFGHSGSEPPLTLDYSRAKRLSDYRQQIRQLRSTLILLPLILLVIARPFTLALASVPAFAAFCVLTVVFIAWTQLWRRQLKQEMESL